MDIPKSVLDFIRNTEVYFELPPKNLEVLNEEEISNYICKLDLMWFQKKKFPGLKNELM